VYQIKTSVI